MSDLTKQMAIEPIRDKLKKCPKCGVDCQSFAKICHACGRSFNKLIRSWKLLMLIFSSLSLVLGLGVVIANQSSQVYQKYKDTEISWAGVMSARGTNRLILDSYVLAIDSGTEVILEKLQFSSNFQNEGKLKYSILVGKGYRPTDVATIRVDPTAITHSYRPVPVEVISLLITSGVNPNHLDDLFKIRPTSGQHKIHKTFPWATVAGLLNVDYYRPLINPKKRYSEELQVKMILWARKPENMGTRLKQLPDNYGSINVDKVISKYESIMKKHKPKNFI